MTDSCGVSTYQYNPLPSETSIRLLELHPGGTSDGITCTLRQVELEDVPEYEAISYAWGDPSRKISVACDDKAIMVTPNLKDALLRLRLKDRSRILWADAICIDQKNDVEKGPYVKLMGKIYEKAIKVCVWLGCTTPEMLPAFGLIEDIVSYESHSSTQTSRLPDPTSESWSALDIFFSATWFTRLWVVQEVYNHTCTVFCGEYELPWKDVVVAASFVCEKSQDPSSAYRTSGNMISALQIDSAGYKSSSKAGIVDSFHHFSCANQRDKIYALLSFPPLCNLQPPIQPDYSKSVAEVFEETVMRMITSNMNLGLLSNVDHGREIAEEWPSWVPRWDQHRTVQMLHKYASGTAHSSLPRISHRPKVLTAEGIRITTISWCGTVIDKEVGASIYEVDSVTQPVQEFLSQYRPKITHPSDPLLLSIAMTLTVGLDFKSNLPPLNMLQFRLDFLSYMRAILPSLDMLGAIGDLSQGLLLESLEGDSLHFYAAAFRGSKNRRFFCTQDGTFGICPRTTQPGDYIALLYGGNAPCVLRPRGSYYQFVGECYLYEHMHGEAITMAAEGLLNVEKFEMR